ncbi:MAG: phosphate ABC transporter substrate-binding protein PstS [Solirubrobacteraceae bacterium]
MRAKTLICLTLGLAMGVGAGSASAATTPTSLSGAGSTLVAPLLAYWASAFQPLFGVTVSYSLDGSPAGVRQLESSTVNFAASEGPLSANQSQGCHGCVLLPWALTGIAVGYHVPGVGAKLQLSPHVLAEIYLGQITSWNDSRVKAVNPGVNLPALRITPVYQTGSGDTYVFTSYLSKADSAWRSKVGFGTTVSFPTGSPVQTSSGATRLLESTNGAIAYVSAAYLIAHGLPAAAIQNAAGKYEYPNLSNIKAAGATVKTVPAGNAVSVVDPPASAPVAYPISTFSFEVLSPNSTASVKAALKQWSLYTIGLGQQFGAGLDFVPVPAVVVNADKTALNSYAP